MEVNLDQATINDIVQKAMFEAMTPERRDELLTRAIQDLLRKRHGAGSGFTPIEDAFRIAASDSVREIARNHVQKNKEFNDKLESLFLDVVKRLFEGEMREKLVDKMVAAIINGMSDSY